MLLGMIAFGFSLIPILHRFTEFGFLAFFLITLTIAPKINIKIPRSIVNLSFSDSMIFLAFLLFGGREAVVIGTLEMLTLCILLKKKGSIFPKGSIGLNAGITAVSTITAFAVLTWLSSILNLSSQDNSATSLISTLGILSLVQFLVSSIFISTYLSLLNGVNPWVQWKESGFPISITQIAGAATAGVLYKLFSYGDYISIAISLTIFAIAYLNYKKIIKDMSDSVEEAEIAQKEKSEIEKLRAEQAEKHAEELALSLKEQKKISAQLKLSRDELVHASLHDALTKLPNRILLSKELEDILDGDAKKREDFYLFYLDLSRFKNINDSLGQTVGDKVLILAARRLERAVRPNDFVTRLASDEFAVVLKNLPSDQVEFYAKRIFKALSQPFSVQGHRIFTKPYIGITTYDPDHKKPEDVLRDADIAMRYAKEAGLEFAFFDKELRAKFLEVVRLESELRYAIERNELSMFYQPLISLSDGGLIGFEALLRWQHPEFGFVPPMKFIPIAEDTGLIIPITEWILEETTSQLAQWQKISPATRGLLISVNISGKHLVQDGLVEDVKSCLEKTSIDPACLKLEITESTAMENAGRTSEILKNLKELGVQLSIDDFGTGYSSLSYLHKLPFDTLKIDRSFVFSVGENGENSEILQTIISLAKNLKMKVIAEGIETESQMNLLQNLGCDFGQGYLFAKPMPKEEMENLLYKRQSWFPEYQNGDGSDQVEAALTPEQALSLI